MPFARGQGAARPRRLPAADADDDRAPQERRPLVRWRRVGIGLGLIAAGIGWGVLNDHLGLVVQPVRPTPVPDAVAGLPALATPQAAGALLLDVKLVERRDSLPGMPAAAGSRYLLLAVLAQNRGAAPLAVSATAFSAATGRDRVAAAGVAGYFLHPLPVPPGASVRGVIAVRLPRGARDSTLRYLPTASGAAALGWRL